MNLQKQQNIQQTFDNIAPKYDRMNLILSFGIHHIWNNVLVKLLPSTDHLLDLCAGTGEIAFNYVKRYPKASATLVDFSHEMLAIAKRKNPYHKCSYLQADVCHLPLPNDYTSVVSIAYGLRNLVDIDLGIQEIYRVLKPKGTLGILELTQPKAKIFSSIHHLYLKTLIPYIGKFYAKNGPAYNYLSNSIKEFHQDESIEAKLKKTKFTIFKKKKLLLGAATIWIVKK